MKNQLPRVRPSYMDLLQAYNSSEEDNENEQFSFQVGTKDFEEFELKRCALSNYKRTPAILVSIPEIDRFEE